MGRHHVDVSAGLAAAHAAQLQRSIRHCGHPPICAECLRPSREGEAAKKVCGHEGSQLDPAEGEETVC